jgi:hypothetical protein
MKHLISLFAFAAAFVYACTGFNYEALDNLFTFFDINSLIIVLVPSAFFCVSATSISDFFSAILCILGKKPLKEKETIQALRILGNTALFCGVLSLLAHTIIVIQNTTTAQQLIEQFHIIFIPLFYGTIVKFLCVAAQNNIQTKLTINDEID